jgi:hypothetical protein
MPVRKVANQGGNVVGHFPSLKLGRMVSYESLIERDLIYLLEFAPDVQWFTEQPLTIPYQHQGKDRGYTPDFHVVRGALNTLVECKPQGRVALAENQRKFVAAQAWCANQGWTFQVITDAQLRRGYRLPNVKLLHQFARYEISREMKQRIQEALASAEEPTTVADLTRRVAPAQPEAAIIPLLHMAFHHELVLQLDDAPITGVTLVQRPTGTAGNPR